MAKGVKTGGRTKNSLNKIPRDLRKGITDFLTDNFNVVIAEWEQLESGKDKLNFYKDLLKYALPALQPIPEKEEDPLELETKSQMEIIQEAIARKRLQASN